MPSTVVSVTSIASLIGFIINILVMFVVLSRGRRRYHLLFALLLFTAAFWDIGVFLMMIRNSFPDEVVLYQSLISVPVTLFPAFVYHFTNTYVKQPRMKSTIAIYAYCLLGPIGFVSGLYRPVSGVYNYSWGIIGRQVFTDADIVWYLIYVISISVSCWLLLEYRKRESSDLTRRHSAYILTSFVVFGLAPVKNLVVYGVDVAFAVPLGILLVDSFGALIGLAIIKDRLFDITVFVRRGIIYSVLAVVIIFIFDFSQHLIAAFLGSMAGEHSTYMYFGSVGVVVIAFMPVKQRLERTIGRILAKKKFEF